MIFDKNLFMLLLWPTIGLIGVIYGVLPHIFNFYRKRALSNLGVQEQIIFVGDQMTHYSPIDGVHNPELVIKEWADAHQDVLNAGKLIHVILRYATYDVDYDPSFDEFDFLFTADDLKAGRIDLDGLTGSPEQEIVDKWHNITKIYNRVVTITVGVILSFMIGLFIYIMFFSK